MIKINVIKLLLYKRYNNLIIIKNKFFKLIKIKLIKNPIFKKIIKFIYNNIIYKYGIFDYIKLNKKLEFKG